MLIYITSRNGLLLSEDHRSFGSEHRSYFPPFIFLSTDARRIKNSYIELHYTTHCINAIIMIIIVIHKPPREAHDPDLPPFAYILHITYYIIFLYFML